MDVSSYNNIEALKLRAAILEEKIRLKLDLIKYLEEILMLRSEIILFQSKKHKIQIQELQDKNRLLVENCTKLVQDLLRMTNECRVIFQKMWQVCFFELSLEIFLDFHQTNFILLFVAVATREHFLAPNRAQGIAMFVHLSARQSLLLMFGVF